ncbi:hypothetical protein [Halobacteriovorax marinus]|nr:hypothetical protein [Halobacteriovorax marinus]
MKIRLILITYIFSFYIGAMPLATSELSESLEGQNYFTNLAKDQPYYTSRCQFTIPFDRTEQFKKSRALLKKKQSLEQDIRILSDMVTLDQNNAELERRKEGYLLKEQELIELSCLDDGPLRPSLRVHDNIENILAVLKEMKGDYHLDILNKSQTAPFKESYSHYVDYKKSVDDQVRRAKRELPLRKRELQKLLNSNEFKTLNEKYSQNDLDKIRDKEISKPPRNYVIVFEGTGGYSPKKAHKLKLLHAQSQYQQSKNYKKKLSDYLSDSNQHEDKAYLLPTGQDTWPGMIYGPLASVVTEIDRERDSNTLTNWNYFPSEPQGKARDKANECLEDYFIFHKKVYGESPLPTITVIGHSSGGYSALQMANRLSKSYPKLYIKLITIDPVIPMERAAANGAARILNPFTEGRIGDHSGRGIFKVEGKNIKAINFYQKQDQVGLSEEAPVPILGSKVQGAKNRYIDFPKGSYNAKKAHGAITYDKRVLEDIEDFISP